MAVTARYKSTIGIIAKDDAGLAVLVLDEPRLRIGNLAARGQLQLQEGPAVFQIDTTATDELAAFLNGEHGGTVDGAPELFDPRMSRAPFVFEAFNLGITEFVRLEIAPGMQTTLIAER